MTDWDEQKRLVADLRIRDWSNPWIHRMFEIGDMLTDMHPNDDIEPVSKAVSEVMTNLTTDPTGMAEAVMQMFMAGAEIASMLGRVGEKFSGGQVNAAFRNAAMNAARKEQQ